MQAANAYMNLLINYAVYRALFNDEDSKLYKKIWALQKLCPIIILYNNLCVNPGAFMSRKVALKKSAKTEPKDIKTFLQEELMKRDTAFVSKVELHYTKLV